MQAALNKQVNAEFYASYLYLSAAAWFESKSLGGFAGWMKAQTGEELGHAMRFFNHIVERGGTVTLTALDGPPAEFESALGAFEAAYGHEQKVTAMINDLVDLAIAERDHAANAMLQWFVTEQVEEEEQTSSAVERLKLADNNPNALLMLDTEFGARVFTLPLTGGE